MTRQTAYNMNCVKNQARIIQTVILLVFVVSLCQGQTLLKKVSYSTDKKIELDQKKVVFVDSGVLKKSMKIRVFWDDRVFFNNYDDDKALDCFTLSTIKNDTISIVGYMNGMLGYGFNLKLIGDSCIIATYALSDGEIYKRNPSDKSYTDFIELPGTVQKVVLSKKPMFKKGEVLTGHVQLKSVPFYYKDLEGKFTIEIAAYFKTAPLK